MSSKYAVVDLFAGPGGLSEGFAQVRDHNGEPVYDVVLSVERETSAHKTLTLRSVVHQLNDDRLQLYRSMIKEDCSEDSWSEVFSEEWGRAKDIALQLELGTEEAQSVVDDRIKKIKAEYDGDTILIGGPPCQAYSLVGRARNLGNPNYRAEDDGRHYLYREYIRILDRLRPAVFIMENVKGILSSKVDGTKIFPIILEDLQSLASEDGGYQLITLTGERHGTLFDVSDPRDFIVRAEDRGVPQARHRVIVVGFRNDKGKRLPTHVRQRGLLDVFQEEANVRSVLAGMPRLRSGLSREIDSDERWRRVVGESICRLLRDDQIVGDDALVDQLRGLAEEIETGYLPKSRESGQIPCNVDMPKYLARWITTPGLTFLPNNRSRAHIGPDLVRYVFASAFALVHGYSPKAAEFPESLAPYHRNWKTGKFNDRFRVQMWDRPSSTVTSHISKDGHYFIHPDPLQVRSLTVREAARLQTFPDDYLFMGNRTQQYVQVGNAVPAFLAYQIGTAIAKTLGL